MAQNNLPLNLGALAVLAGQCSAGLTTYATALKITQITAAGLTTDGTALQTAMGSFNATRAARTTATATLHTASDAAKAFLTNARSVLVAHWGQDYSQNWASAGWTDNSTTIPDTQPARLALVQALGGFLTANPAMAVSAPLIVFTAAQVTSVAGALQDALDGVGAADTAATNAKAARTTADTALRKDLRALIGVRPQRPGQGHDPRRADKPGQPTGAGRAGPRDVRRADGDGSFAVVRGEAGSDGVRVRGGHGDQFFHRVE